MEQSSEMCEMGSQWFITLYVVQDCSSMQVVNIRRKKIQRDEDSEDIVDGWNETWGFLDSARDLYS